MGIIKATKLVYDYITRDDDEKTETADRAVDHLDVEIEPGSFVAVLGHNGSGKSTFAKTLNGILLPTEGTVLISGMDTADDSHIWDVRKTVGMVFQNPDNQIIANVVEEDVGFGPENPESCGHDSLPAEVPEPPFRRTEAARSHRGRHGHEAQVHRP